MFDAIFIVKTSHVIKINKAINFHLFWY